MSNLGVLQSVYHGDKASYLKDSVQSILNESNLIFEYCIVVDGPVGRELSEYLSGLQHLKFMRIHYLESNNGLAQALNYGLKNMSADLILRMDSDDIAVPGRIETSLKIFQEKKVDVLGFSKLTFCGGIEDFIADNWSDKRLSFLISFLLSSPLNHPTVLFKRNSILQVGGYPNIYRREDSALWLRLKSQGFSLARSETATLYFRQCDFDLERRLGWRYSLAELQLIPYKLKAFPMLFFIVIPSAVLLFLLRNVPAPIFRTLYRGLKK